ncbi:MAG: hypothetical protein KGJ57_15100 [Sphingomonadales bacterium]|nr:hypothetical protein [Sphingomonadales bacterium]MDE2170731.1 hypothetical protein [Sphingomonadales bacterium]
MRVFRAFALNHRCLAVLLVALALCMKALVPAGYMLASDRQVVTIRICADTVGQMITKQIVLPQNPQTPGTHKGKGESPCHFTALGHGLLGAVEPILLALALITLMALGFAPMRPATAQSAARLRPPLRGPPAPA